MTKHLEIVTHCYNPPGLNIYGQLLKWQFASLWHYPTHHRVTLTVCYTGDDGATRDRVQKIGHQIEKGDREGLELKALDFPPGSLFRRGVGRNFCALQTVADVIWFTDVDYMFGPGCLDALGDMCDRGTGLVMPAQLWMSRTHAIGDQDLWEQRDNELPEIPVEHFAQRRQRICIGGCQIVGGHLANRIGYCSGTKWSQPVSEAEGFRSCKCDKYFRRLNNLKAERLPIPAVYRMRHGVDGRDYDLTGVVRGKEVW